ncbi:extracellular solute-binding protein [Paenibacillus sp. J5C_2022]|uniref:extracellular solute-binding protein n=1 Tax=Paenibacillus sp. J5C2022 TaxID=2977129 RepID=UPI0021CF5CAB|nr:extracellular solute-binding protein [Paenibacillus sp. J5C2022]MCU6708930.1 extracellular solute-binding protein [Paenibacillus sp. J5C2022]
MGKRTLLLTMCFILSITMVLGACSSGGSGEEPAGNVTDSDDSSAVPGNNDPLGQYDPPISISTVKRIDANLKLPDGQTNEDNIWTQSIAAELGIHIKTEWIADASQYDNKLNMSIASGSLPDFMRVNQEQLNQLIESDSLEDLSEVYDKYASPDTKQQYGVGDSIALKAASVGDKLYAIPNTASAIAGAGSPLLWIRTDWLDHLNLSEPESMQDLFDIAKAFTNNDPDGNGKKDTVGLAFVNGQVGDLGIYNGFHAYPSAWIQNESGKLVYGSVQPEMKKALEEMQQLYKDGAIDPEFAVKDWGKWNEMLTSGQVGIAFAAHWFGQLVHNLKVRDSKAEWKPYLVPSIDDKPSKITLRSPVLEYYVVKKGYKHPEALIKMFNYYYSLTVGERATQENYHKYMYDKDDGSIQYVALAPIHTNDATDVAFKQMVEAFDSNDAAKAKAMDAKTIYENATKALNGENSLYGWTLYYPAWKLFFDMMDNELYVNNAFYGAPTDTMRDKAATLSKLEFETFTKIIMGETPIDEFDKFVDHWNKLGGEQITKEVNAWSNSVK